MNRAETTAPENGRYNPALSMAPEFKEMEARMDERLDKVRALNHPQPENDKVSTSLLSGGRQE